ncbi:MAG: hypothetical protein R3B99_00060 [Polyangiales bacterium]
MRFLRSSDAAKRRPTRGPRSRFATRPITGSSCGSRVRARTSALAPRAETVVELCEGTYDLAAELAAPDFVPFVGQGDVVENGFAYEIVFYVLRAPETTRRRRAPALSLRNFTRRARTRRR